MKQLERTNRKLKWSLRVFLVSLVVALGAAIWRNQLAMSGAWLPEHSSQGLYVLLGYAITLGSVAWFVSGGASLLFFFERRTDRKVVEREREEERAKGRVEWESKYGKSDD